MANKNNRQPKPARKQAPVKNKTAPRPASPKKKAPAKKPVKPAVPAKKQQAGPAPKPHGHGAKNKPATGKPAPVKAGQHPHKDKAGHAAEKKQAQPAKQPAVKHAPPATDRKSAGRRAAGEALRKAIMDRSHKPQRPIAFTLDEVREIVLINQHQARTSASGKPGHAAHGKPSSGASAKTSEAAPHFIKPASLTDILGFNPGGRVRVDPMAKTEVPPKYQRYYRLLVELRNHVVDGLSLHTEETLKHSTKEDSGDLSGYGQHMADAGTDTFDRDFALSLVSSEQEALSEIEAAIQRIHKGTYGICELTGRPIARERLMAVPFARYSVESQTEVERQKRRAISRSGVFGEGAGEETGKFAEEEEAE